MKEGKKELLLEKMSFSYGRKPLLHELDLQAQSGEFVAILGRNGSGKTTLFRILLGQLRANAGEVRVNGKRIHEFTPAQLASEMAFIPQSSESDLRYTGEELVLMGASVAMPIFSMPGKKEEQMALAAMAKLGVEELASRPLFQLSGGERQLLLIARALAQNASILVMDEPCSSLDYGNQYRVLSQVHKLTREGYLVLLSTHDPHHAQCFADRIFLLHEGRWLENGSVEQVLNEDNLAKLYGIQLRMIRQGNDRALLPDLSMLK